jgi:dTDP-4-dehydrorhamnose reductase
MKILVTGAAGLLGRAMSAVLADRHQVVAFTTRDLDLRDGQAVRAALDALRPEAIVNCAAYTDVDGAEDRPVDALAVNAFAVRSLAASAAALGATFVHYSTDFVFDGRANVPYSENDVPNPRSTYACSKLIGEWFAAEAPRHFVLRVESLFGAPPGEGMSRRSSVDRIVDAILAGEEARVFVDRTVSPSYLADICAATSHLIEHEAPYGLYHCVNTGACTWHELAVEIARQLGIDARLRPVPVAEVRLRAERPTYCALSSAKLASVGALMPAWQDAIRRYLLVRTAATAGRRLDRPVSAP